MTTENPTPIALITGASRGLGRAGALALADAGVDVIATYNSSEAEAREVVAEVDAKGRRGVALKLDTTDRSSFPAFVARVRGELLDGKLDVLVNNAGTGFYSLLQDTTETGLDEVFDVHVKGPFFLTQALEPLLADGAKIINISTALTRLSFPRSGPYAMAKGALEVLTRYQAVEYGTRGITANTLAVGAVPTDFGGGHLRSNPELQEMMIQAAALKRLATPEDVAAAITGLSTASGTWITGQRIEASGGI
ncbi:MAG: SDR family NAD(P)-dependent oxidoreductase [Solirubrobacteraceae bacterium]